VHCTIKLGRQVIQEKLPKARTRGSPLHTMCRLHILSCGHVHIRLVINSTSSLDCTDDRDGSTYLGLDQIDCKYDDSCLSGFHMGVVHILPCYIHVPRRLVSNATCFMLGLLTCPQIVMVRLHHLHRQDKVCSVCQWS